MKHMFLTRLKQYVRFMPRILSDPDRTKYNKTDPPCGHTEK